jgi:hypothetical protein
VKFTCLSGKPSPDDTGTRGDFLMEMLNRLDIARSVAIRNGATSLVADINIAERVLKACYQVKYLIDMEKLYSNV